MKRVPGGSGEGSGNGEKLRGSSLAWWVWHASAVSCYLLSISIVLE